MRSYPKKHATLGGNHCSGDLLTTALATIAGLVILVGIVVPIMRPRGIDSLMKDAKRSGDLTPLAAMLAATPENARADKIDQACTKLWNAYEREATARLLVEVAPHSDAPIVQYWIKQVLEIEPTVASPGANPDDVVAIGNQRVFLSAEVGGAVGGRV